MSPFGATDAKHHLILFGRSRQMGLEKTNKALLFSLEHLAICHKQMKQYSTREVAEKLGLHLVTIQTYIAEGKIPAPPLLKVGKGKLRIWTDEDIESVRQILPKIANGRKTRYQKKQSAVSTQQSDKAKKTQARVPAPHKQRKPKKK
jgi:excisionase family DNA binding protein